MRIPTARYITEDDIKIVKIKEITKKKYEAVFKGKLYCPTENCTAKLSYCGGRKAHYKTWRFSHHSSDCKYQLDRSGSRFVTGFKETVKMNISHKRKYDALTRAYKTMIRAENIEPDNDIQLKQKEAKNRSPKKAGEQKDQSIQLNLFGGQIEEGHAHFKGKKLLSKFVDGVSLSDIGQVRLIKGFIKDIELIDSVAEITIVHHDQEMKVVFDEEFKNETLNKSYLDKFWSIKDLLSIQRVVVFNGVGEIREEKKDCYELVVTLGSDIRFNGEDLYNIARVMKLAVTI